MFTGKRVVVTGSKGFIGQRLVQRLKAQNAIVSEYDLQLGHDLTNWQQMNTAGKFDLVFHLAARSFVPDAYENPRDFYHTNLLGTTNMLDLCRRHGAKMVFVSSYVYGPPKMLPIDEMHPLNGFNPYAQTKILGEQICEGYYRHHGVKCTILRPFNIYGSGQGESFLIPLIFKQAKEGRIHLKSAEPKRDFVFVDDVVSALEKAGLYQQEDFDVFNIGYGKSYSVRETAALIASFYDENMPITFSGETRPNEVMDVVCNNDKAQALLGWQPKYDLADGLREMFEN